MTASTNNMAEQTQTVSDLSSHTAPLSEGVSWRKHFPHRNGSAGPKTAENGCCNGSAVVTKSILSPNIRCCDGSLARSEDMSVEIVYSLNKIIHSSTEIAYKKNQSTHLMNEITFSWNETRYPGLRMRPNLGKTPGYKYTTNLTINPRWQFSRGRTISVAASVLRGAKLWGGGANLA